MCDLEALKTIREFIIASEQRVVVLKKNLVDYGINESSNSSEEDQVDSSKVVSPSEAGKKRKVNEYGQKAEETVPVKRKCTGNDLLPDIPSTASVTGPVDTRCVIARPSLDSTLDIQRIAESFESKHYGRKSVEFEGSDELTRNHFPAVNPPKKHANKTVFSLKAKSPKYRFFEEHSTSSFNSISGCRAVDEVESPKLSQPEVKLRRIAETQTSGKPKNECRSKTLSSTFPQASSANGVSTEASVSLSIFDEHSSSQSKANLSSPKKHPFRSSLFRSSVSSPLWGGQENVMNEKSVLKNRLRTLSAPENKLSTSDTELQTTQEQSNVNTRTTSVISASPWSHRLRFYQNSRLSDSFLPQVNMVSYNWKENFKKTYSEYSVPYFDSHCHIDFLFSRQRFCGSWSRFKAVNQETFPDNFAGCVAVFCNPLTFKPEGLWKDVSCESDVWLAFGCHPKSATDFSVQRMYGLKDCLQHKKVVALGEIGLDYSGTFKQHMDIQKIVFRKQIQIALEMTKPLVIHCRDAEEDCLQILIEMVPMNYKIHCHCFTGDYAGAKRWLETFPNLYIGLTPMVTYRQCVQTHNVARSIPLNRLLLETDAPYFLPRKIPKEEMPLSHPGMAVTVAERVAYFQQCSVQDVLVACRNNMKEMYGI